MFPKENLKERYSKVTPNIYKKAINIKKKEIEPE